MKKVVSMILTFVMVFNIFITNVDSSLVYANNNAPIQELNNKEVLTIEQKQLDEVPKDTIEEKSVEKTNLLTEESKDNPLQGTNQEKIGNKKEQSLKESERMQSFKEESGLSIKVDAPKGAFPSGTTASITPISRDKNKISYDITFRDVNKREVQPENGKSVEVSFTVDKTPNLILNKGFVSLKLYHIVDGVSREIDSKVTLGERVTLSAKVNHFSEFQVVTEENIDLSLVKNAAEPVKVGENKKVDVDITKFDIQNVNQTTAQNIYWSEAFLLMMNWDASKNDTNLHEGDYFDVKLPDEMKFPSDTTARDFELKNSEGIVVASAHVTPGADDTGGTIRVTFTKAVENKYNVKGTMYLAARFNKDKITLNQSNTFTITVGSQVLTDNVNIVGPKELQNNYLGKWGGKFTGNPKEVVWHVRINHAGDELSTVVIKDDFSKTGEKLVDKSFVLKKVEFTKYGDIRKVIEDNIDLTSKLQVSPDKNSFTLTLGDLGKDDRYYLGYRTTYTPGTTLKNELDLISVQQQIHTFASYRSAESGGTGDGDLASKIKLIKVDEENTKTKLANAVFEVTKPNGEKFELKTGENGEVISGILEQGEYKVKEKIAPIGYELNEEEYTLKVTPTGGAIQTITNKPIKRDVAVKKLWGGMQLESCTVKLYADDKEIDSIVLNKDKEWKHTFTNLRKFNSEGKEIKYSVKEEVPKGYKAEYHGDMEKGFSIINTQDVTDITATKKWEGGPSEKPTVWFKLYRKIAGEEAKPVEGVFEQPLHNGDTSVTWSGLPKTNDEGKEYVYSVKEGELKDGVFIEKAPKNYIKTENGLTVTNKYCSPKIDIKGKKVWENEGEKPTIKLQLFKNGQAEGNPVELKDGKTEHTWKNLPKTDKDGKDYEYTVKEVDEVNEHIKIGNTWYKVTYEGNTQTGFTIKNKKLPPLTPMEPPTREIKVVKNWELLGTEKTVEKIEVELYRDGLATGKKLELTKDNNWSGEFKKLEVADKLGSTNYYNYTVKEIGENAGSIKFGNTWYKVSYEGNMKDGFKITNKELPPYTPMIPPTREIKVTKLWKDHNGSTITAPTDKITVELYKDGVATGKTAELNVQNKWTFIFKNLEVADRLGSTNYYNYTVKEVGENGNIIKIDTNQYKVVYGGSMKDGLTITNEKETPPVPPTPPNTEKPKVPNTNTNNSLPKTGDGADLSLYAWLTFASGSLLILLGIRKRKHAK